MTTADLNLYLGLLVLAFIYAWPYQLLRAAQLEEDLRDIRDDLWDYMLHRGQGFDDPAYLNLRLCFNGFIRLAKYQQVGLWYMTSLVIRESCLPSSTPTDFITADRALQKKLTEAEDQLRQRIFKFLFLEDVRAVILYPLQWLIQLMTGHDLFRNGHNLTSIKRLQRYAWYLGATPVPQAWLMLGLDKIRYSH